MTPQGEDGGPADSTTTRTTTPKAMATLAGAAGTAATSASDRPSSHQEEEEEEGKEEEKIPFLEGMNDKERQEEVEDAREDEGVEGETAIEEEGWEGSPSCQLYHEEQQQQLQLCSSLPFSLKLSRKRPRKGSASASYHSLPNPTYSPSSVFLFFLIVIFALDGGDSVLSHNKSSGGSVSQLCVSGGGREGGREGELDIGCRQCRYYGAGAPN